MSGMGSDQFCLDCHHRRDGRCRYIGDLMANWKAGLLVECSAKAQPVHPENVHDIAERMPHRCGAATCLACGHKVILVQPAEMALPADARGSQCRHCMAMALVFDDDLPPAGLVLKFEKRHDS